MRYSSIWFLLLWICSISLKIVAQDRGKLTNLGPQVSAAAIQGSTFFENAEGEEMVFTVVRGLPARFVGFKTKTGEKVVESVLEGTDGSWDLVVSSDGIVYVAGANGHLFSHKPGTATVTDHGKPLPAERLIWDLTAGRNGEVYGGTYPGCRVFRYHPSTGATDLTGAPIVENENYVRSLEYHGGTEKLFIGVGSHAHMIMLDLKKGTLKDILSEEDHAEEFVYNMRLIGGLRGGDRIFASLTGADKSKNKTMVYNVASQKFEKSLPVLSIKEVIKAPKGNLIYYFSQGGLYTLDYGKKNREPKRLTDFPENVRAVRWDNEGKLSILTIGLKVVKFDPVTLETTSRKLDVPRLPIAIQSILFGPDKRVWSAGYLAGGHAAWDPATGKTTDYDGLHQTEGMAFMGNDLYFGVYTDALMYRYDVTRPWTVKEGNPRLLGKVPGQDRPFAVLPLEEKGIVLFGTIPAYGQLGGAIAHYHTHNDRLEFFDRIVPEQAISSLVQAGGKVFGATTIFGGLGVAPTQKEAVVFEWDVANGRKVSEFVPVEGQMAFTGLTEAPDGSLWGVGDGVLFVYDLQKKEVRKTLRLYELPGKPSHIWRNAFIKFHPNGRAYVAAQGKLYSITPHDYSYEVVAENVELLTMDDQGNLYMKRGSDLFRYEPLR